MIQPNSAQLKVRRWHNGPVLIVITLFKILGSFRRNHMQGIIPFILFLYLVALLVYIVHLVSPLAPFVYSLF